MKQLNHPTVRLAENASRLTFNTQWLGLPPDR
jgi:hypothetical protein